MAKIFWKPEEKTLLAQEWARLKKENPAALIKDLAVKVQLVLPGERRRPLKYHSEPSRIRHQVEDWLKALPAPPLPVRIEPEESASGLDYADLEALPLGLLLGVVLDRLLARTLLADTPQAPTVTRTLAPGVTPSATYTPSITPTPSSSTQAECSSILPRLTSTKRSRASTMLV